MKILKPTWIDHNQLEIYSCDIHPDGTRFATAGGDKKIKIWNMLPVISEKAEEKEDVPKLLCVLGNHYGAVNCVRWSPNGRYLASGSDDKLVLLFEKMSLGNNVQNTSLFGSGEKIIENWRCICQLNGHTVDVVDLSWSPDGNKLASCSLDNTIIIWDVNKKEQLKKLVEHEGWVKGVCWDPIGKYLASASDDKSVIIWKTNDWSVETKIQAPFKSSSATFFRRLSWSPEGSFIATAHSANNNNQTSAIIKRNEWTNPYDFVGHKQPITIAKFNGNIFRTSSNSNYFICAVGCQDSSISIWSTEKKRPIVVLKEAFSHSILDIAWSKDGYKMICCSTDGTVAYLLFDQIELGGTLSENELNIIIKKLYGDIIHIPDTLTLVESPLQLELEQQMKNKKNDINELINTPLTKIILPIVSTKQIETRLPNGKRKIIPQFIGSLDSTSNIISNPLFTLDISNSISPLNKIDQNNNPNNHNNENNNQINNNNKNNNNNQNNQNIENKIEENEIKKIDLDKLTPPQTPNILTTEIINNEKRKISSNDNHDNLSKKQKLHKKEKEKFKNLKKKKKESSSQENSKASSQKTTKNHIFNIYINPPTPSPKLIYELLGDNEVISNKASIFIEVTIIEETFQDNENNYISNIICYNNEKQLWENFIKARVILVTGNLKFSSVACEDGSLYIYSMSGRHIFPCICIGENFSFLECNRSNHLIAITCSGIVYIWDIIKQISILQTDIMPLLKKKEKTIKKVKLTDNGNPVIILSDYQSFTFDLSMKIWVRVADDKFINSEFYSILNWKANSFEKGILFELQNLCSQNLKISSIQNLTQKQKKIETISHLENQISSSLSLQSPREFKYWLQIYFQKLTEENDQNKLDEICSFLLGPPYKISLSNISPSNNWEPFILGIPKRELLSELLPIISSNRHLQRLIQRYKEGLDLIHNSE